MAKTPKIKRRRHIFRLDMGDGQIINIAVPWVPAKHTVQILRSKKDVLTGMRGIAVACADAKCAKAWAHEFPHPVYLAEFCERFAYIVDTRCVKYVHDDGAWIQKFDRPGGKAELLKADDVERIVTLSPPPKRGSQAGQQRPKGKNDGSRSRRHNGRGSEKRAIAAQWVLGA